VRGWAYNTLIVAGAPEELRAFKRAVRASKPDPKTGRREVLDFGRHRPMPSELLVEKGSSAAGGLPGWLAWRIENWGTKWNAVSPTVSGTPHSGELRYRFQTAWTPPVEWLQFVAGVYPALRFELSYRAELGDVRGVLRLEGGRVVEDRCRAIFGSRERAQRPRLEIRSSTPSW
jgi:hypothetical protein